MDYLMDWIVCGRKIGKATGWSVADTFTMHLYGLQPAPEYTGPVAECVTICFERGVIEVLDEDGNVTQSSDLIESIRACQVARME